MSTCLIHVFFKEQRGREKGRRGPCLKTESIPEYTNDDDDDEDA